MIFLGGGLILLATAALAWSAWLHRRAWSLRAGAADDYAIATRKLHEAADMVREAEASKTEARQLLAEATTLRDEARGHCLSLATARAMLELAHRDPRKRDEVPRG